MKNNARKIAVKILNDISNQKAYSNIIINKKTKKLDNRDKAFVRQLVYGVLENKLYIDWIIKKFSKIKFKKISPIIKEILRIGIYQIMFMDKVPNSAACNECVKAAKKLGNKRASGFINGILRNVIRKKHNIRLPNKNRDITKYLCIKYSHPHWMVKRWIDKFGKEFTEKLCRANNKKPFLNIRVNTLHLSRQELISLLNKKGLIVTEGMIADDAIIVKNPINIVQLEEYKKGYFFIQDESSMLVSQIMNPKSNSFIIDLCSAPGGKTTHIAQLMNNKGSILAIDKYKKKLDLVERNAKRLGINIIDTKEYDSTNLNNQLIEKADYCLVDAPCSGLGIIRRKPEIKWNKTEKDINNLIDIQYKIIVNAAKYLKKGGVLVYSTCTIESRENIELINKFLKNNSNFNLMPFNNITELENSEKGYVQLYPHLYNVDGFFIAKMIKG